MSSFKNGPFSFYIEYRADINSYYIQIYGEAWNEYVVDKTSSVDFNSSKSIVPSGVLNWKVYDAAVVKAEVSAEMIAANGGDFLWNYFNNNSVVPSYWKSQPTFRQGLDRLAQTISTGGLFKAYGSPMEKYYSGGYISKEHLMKSVWDTDGSWSSYKKKFLEEEKAEYSIFKKATSESASADFSTKSHKLPGVGEVVSHPSSNYKSGSCFAWKNTDLWRLIQHLNDYHRMTRDEIADWVETLDIDINFKAYA